MESHEKTLRRTYENLQIAKRSGDRDAIKEAQEKYERAVKNVTLNNDKYKAMLNETTAKLAHVNEVALSYINNKTPKIYTLNYNEFANQDIDGYTFTLVNENAVRNLIKSDKIELPPKKLDVPKDKRWNAKNINSQLMQGLLQGESIPKIAKRLQTVTDMNERSAIRNARTMVTGAENKGRQDSFTKATDDGVIMERKWVAAYEPGRTRDWHLELNGVTVGVDEPFENSVGKIMYPGDPSADPSNVYNCRCAIRAIVKGFKWGKQNSEEVADEAKEENIVAGVDIDTPQYDAFSDEFKAIIPQLADDIKNSTLPDFDELYELYNKAKKSPVPEDKELVRFVNGLQTSVQSYKDESPEVQKYHAEIFSVLSKPHNGALFRGESGEWVKHYGDFTVGKEISFEHLSFTSPNIEGAPSLHTGVIFEFKSGTKSINFVGQDNVDDDELILGRFVIKRVDNFNGVPRVLLEHKEESEIVTATAKKTSMIPTNAKELSKKWDIPVAGLKDDTIKNMDDALTYMQNEFGVNPKKYISLIDNKNPDLLRRYQAYYSEYDRGIHVHKELANGKDGFLDPSVCAHEIMHALNGYLSVLETSNGTTYQAERIANEIVKKVYSENGYDINSKTGLPLKEIIAKTTTKYGSTNSLETLAVSMELTYEKEVMGLKGTREIPRKICDEVKRRLKDDIE